MPEITYDRPIAAKLVVRLDNGEEHEAGPEDLEMFGLVRRLDAYMSIHTYLENVAAEVRPDDDLTDVDYLNVIRYLAVSMVCYPHIYAEHKAKYDDALLPALRELAAMVRPEEDGPAVD